MHTKNPTSALAIHALRWIGRKHVDDETIVKLRRNLKPSARAALVQDVELLLSRRRVITV